MPNLRQPDFDEPRSHPGFACRRARLGHQLATTRLGVSLWELPPGEAAYPYHFHLSEEEVLIVLEGSPHLRTPDGWRELPEGEVVAFPVGQDGAHQLDNRTDATIRFLAVSTHGHARGHRLSRRGQGRLRASASRAAAACAPSSAPATPSTTTRACARRSAMSDVRLDHVVIAVTDWERANAVYRDVCGAELIRSGRWPVHVLALPRSASSSSTVHGPGVEPAPVARVTTTPGSADLASSGPGRSRRRPSTCAPTASRSSWGRSADGARRGAGTSVYFAIPTSARRVHRAAPDAVVELRRLVAMRDVYSITEDERRPAAPGRALTAGVRRWAHERTIEHRSRKRRGSWRRAHIASGSYRSPSAATCTIEASISHSTGARSSV